MVKYCICAFPHKLGRPSQFMTLQLLYYEFPYIYEENLIFFFIIVPWSLFITVSIISILRLYNDFIQLLTCCTVINLGNVGQLRVDLRKHSFYVKTTNIKHDIYVRYSISGIPDCHGRSNKIVSC
jgi:hypothetical protein